MNRFVYGRGWVFSDETNGEGDGNGGAGGAAGAGDAGGGAGDDAGQDAGADDAGAAGAKADEQDPASSGAEGAPKDMLEAITKGLEKTAPKVEKTEEEKAAEAAAAAAADKHPNGQPKKDAKGNELDDQGKITKPAEAPKAKTAAELELKPEERKALGAKAQQRFGEVITTLKARETEIATLTEQMKPLAEARDTMVSILQETNTTSAQLSAYLEFNRMLQSNDAKDLESALQMVEAQRGALYKALNREPGDGGIDLLDEFPDLKADVDDAKITRERALELAGARRAQAAGEQQRKAQERTQQTAEQTKKAQEKSLADITAWTTDLVKKDIDYKAKEPKLLEQVDEVIKNYPPAQWLPTLKLLYSGIAVQKAASLPRKENTPIRPSGAKPGSKAPQNMFEAMWGTKAE